MNTLIALLFAAKLAIVQLQYGGGGDWYANPSGLPNLLRAIRERTGLDVVDRPLQLKLTDPNLWSHPYIYITGHGNIRFTEEEVQILRKYLTSGGFLHADDNYGLDESFRRELKRVFPDNELVELPASHPIYHVLYDFPNGLPKVHQHEGKPAQGLGIIHEGRVVVFYSFESDLGNGWEDAERYNDSAAARENALRMGVNLFLYAIAQVTK
ncbi:MAG: DUF4159 domain-containing protein [Gemmatimonadota bacterium]